MKVKVYHNGDDVFIAWKPQGFIPDCRGFALFRRRNGIEEIVSTWVGFENEPHPAGARRASTNWPIQKYQWTDYMASPGDKLQYRVVPMVGPDRYNLHAASQDVSDWTEEMTLTHEVTPHIEAYFNRGIVAAQWVSRRLGVTAENLQTTKLRKIIETAHDPFRDFLAGPLGQRLFGLLEDAARKKRDIYAALYELHDRQLEAALLKCGRRAHVVLANGSVKLAGQDQNEPARSHLQGKIDLHDRYISPGALGHNKFLVICGQAGEPRRVWTGSQNWTMTGLCTQANNSVLIDDADVALEYKKQWDLLKEAKDETPDTLKRSNSRARDPLVGKLPVRLWFTPTIGQVDLNEAADVIAKAKQAILFLMFNPGPKDTLLNRIIEKARKKAKGKRLYIKGAINQDPSSPTNHVELFEHGNKEEADFDIVLPAAVDQITAYWQREIKKLPRTFAMVHSKVVLVDPLGTHPVVITGSHNLGPKASGTNDENLLIIRDAPGLAAAYLTNIMAVYNQYRWRFRTQLQKESKRWKGLWDNDRWQHGYLKAGSPALREIDFWVGN